tara:strand:+ start:755 stop:1156 length:402 start_codon:yes stop_codon:yes gene_type:complete
MDISKAELPSNKKFGFFFSSVFLICAIYFFYTNQLTYSLGFFSFAIIFIYISIVKDGLLLPFNRLWMRFGMLLGMIISPIILAILFFLIFTPIAIVMKIFKRDELILKSRNADSFWRQRIHESPNAKSFTQQF